MDISINKYVIDLKFSVYVLDVLLEESVLCQKTGLFIQTLFLRLHKI